VKLCAGKMRWRITLVSPSYSRDSDYGSPVSNNADVATVWAEKIEMMNDHKKTAEQLHMAQTIIFLIRYRDDVISGMLVKYKNNLHKILQLKEVGHREGLLLTVEVPGVIAA
jgi:SPP1 family predicted phage head-tail adaptor